MATNDIGIEIGADLNTKEAEAKLKEFTKIRETTIKVNVNGESIDRVLRTYEGKMGKLFSFQDSGGNEYLYKMTQGLQKVQTETSKFIDKTGALNTYITTTKKMGDETQWFQTRVKEATDEQGRLVTTTQDYTKVAGKLTRLGEERKTIVNDETKAIKEQAKVYEDNKKKIIDTNTSITERTQKIDNLSHSIKEEIKTTTDANNTVTTLKTTTDSYQDKLGNLITTVTEYNSATGQTTTETTKIANANKKLGQSFTDVIGKVAKFYLATLPIQAMQKAITEAVQTIKDFDDAMTDFKKVSDLNGESLNDYTDKLAKLGETVARTRTEMVQNATIFKQGGYSDEDSAELARIASLYQNVADSEVSAGDAGQFVISQMKAFHLTASQAESIVDKLNETSNNFAVSNTDLAQGLSKSASALSALGNTQDQTIGLITAGTEIMVGQASTVSRGLQTIGININKVAQTSKQLEIAVGGATKQIDLFDDAGNQLSTFDVLKQISEQWDNMTTSEKTAIASTLAGKTRFSVFTSVLSNFDDAIKATNTSINSQGSAMKENEKYMNSLQAKFNMLKKTFQDIVINKGIQSLANTLISIANGMLSTINMGTKLINALGGIKSVVVILTSLLLTLKSDAIAGLISAITKLAIGALPTLGIAIKNFFIYQIPNAITGLELFITSMVEGTNVTAGLGIALESLTPIIAVISVAFMALMTMIENLDKESKYSKKSISELEGELQSSSNEIESIKKKIEEIDDKIKQIDPLKLTNAEEINNLNKEKDILEEQLILQQQINEASDYQLKKKLQQSAMESPIKGKKAKDWIKEGLATVAGVSSYLVGGWSVALGAGAYVGSKEKSYDERTPYEKIGDVIKKLKDSKGKDDPVKIIADVKPQLEILQKYYDTLKEGDSDYSKVKERIDELNTAYEESSKLYNKDIDLKDKDKNTTDALSLALDDEGESIEDNEDKIKELENQLKNFDFSTATIEGLSDAFNNVKVAISDYNDDGIITIDNYNKLMSLGSEYINLLFDEQGNLKATTNAEKDLQKAKIDEMAITQARHLLDTAKAYKEEYGSLKGLSSELKNTAKDTWDLVYADLALYSSQGEDISALKKQIDMYRTWADSAKNAVDSQERVKESTDSTTKKIEKQAKALKSNVDILQKEVDKYKNTISYIEKQIDKYIDKIKDQKSAEINAIEEKINALKDAQKSSDGYYDNEIDRIEELKKAYDDEVDSRINSLEAERDAEKERWQTQIDLLEEANNVLEENNKLQELNDNLTKAKNKKVKVYKEGQGFVYDQDTEEVKEAQKALNEYNQKKAYEKKLKILKDYQTQSEAKYNRQIQALKNTKNKQDKIYEEQKTSLTKAKNDQNALYQEQINNLETLKTNTQEKYDAIIQKYEDWKQKFKDSVDSYDEQQARLQGLELTGIDLENTNWIQRIDNLNGFVNSYKGKLSELQTAQENYNAIQSQLNNDAINSANSVIDAVNNVNSTMGANNYSLPSIGETGVQSILRDIKNILVDGISVKPSTDWVLSTNWGNTQTNPFFNSSKNLTGGLGLKAHANGIASVSGKEVAITGENPNKEIVLGSKANGVLTSIDKGGGVVNSKSTRTLAGLLNSLGTTNFGGANGTLNNNTTNNSNDLVIKGDIHIDGSNITDIKSFKRALMTFKNDAMQRAYAR